MKTTYNSILIGTLLLSSGCTVVQRPPYDTHPTRDGMRSAPDYRQPQAEYYVDICHKGRDTLSIPQAAVDGHLRHGDYQGACRTRQPPAHHEYPRDTKPPQQPRQRYPDPPASYPPSRPERPSERKPPRAEESATVCYNGTTLQLSLPEAKQYLKRGAQYGSCSAAPPPQYNKPEQRKPAPEPRKPAPVFVPPESRKPSPKPADAQVTICHKDKNTLSVPESAVPGHLQHGDRYGACQ